MPGTVSPRLSSRTSKPCCCKKLCTKAAKREKLLQFADRVWHINTGSEDERIEAAIAKTQAFFEAMGIATHLSAYDLGKEAVDAVVNQLEQHGMVALGEHGNIDPAMSRDILTLAL